MFMSAIAISVLLAMGLGLMQSSWDLARSWINYQEQEIQRFEGRIKRIDDLPVTAVNLVQLNWKNDGGAPLADFADWDVILEIAEGSGIQISPLAYTASTTPGTNEWAIQGIYQDAALLTPEIADPGILNPDEEMVVLLNPSPAVTTNNFQRISTITESLQAFEDFGAQIAADPRSQKLTELITGPGLRGVGRISFNHQP
jgi:hypothetical protein